MLYDSNITISHLQAVRSGNINIMTQSIFGFPNSNLYHQCVILYASLYISYHICYILIHVIIPLQSKRSLVLIMEHKKCSVISSLISKYRNSYLCCKTIKHTVFLFQLISKKHEKSHLYCKAYPVLFQLIHSS